MILEGKTIIITGVGSGLGREMALAAVKDGANVVLGARTEKQLDAVAAEADPSGKQVATVVTDITDEEACRGIVTEAEKRFGGVDGIVQVAAFEYAMGKVSESDLSTWTQAMETNVMGTMKMVRSAAPAMKKRGGGSVVLIGSQSLFLPLIEQAGYAASKGALLSAMYYLTKELGPDKIRVNTVLPSWMWGPPVQMFVQMEAKGKGISEDEVIAGITAGIPLGEIAADDDVAQAAMFLLSNRARMISGQSLAVNGGEWMR
jgi:NAD(P)-dependent dehydrogenase (short-subunit alcohol dehydrogenase family)